MRLTKGIKFEIIEADLENKDKLIYGVFESEVKGRTIYYARLKNTRIRTRHSAEK